MTDTPLKSRKIRVFISSTFRDMNTERDHLVKYIFPQVEAYCRSRALEFVPIDLRWGIPEEESRNGLVLNACMEEVDNSRPFFIGILGSRYGWTPGVAELDALSPALAPQTDWMLSRVADGASITEMEIDYAVLRDMDIPYAAFFFRSPSVEIPDEFREPRGSQAERRLETLKGRIRAQQKYPVADYTTAKELGEMVYDRLIAMIDARFPAGGDDRADDALLLPHETALANRADTLCDITSARSDFDRWIESKAKVMLLRGPSGGGTSTVLAYSTADLRLTYPGYQILYFDFESAPAGTDPIDALKRFMAIDSNRLPDDRWNMVAIDNASFLDPEDIDRLCDWIDSLADSTHVAMAVVSESRADDMIKYRFGCPTSTINGYTASMSRDYATNYAARYGKRLTPAQVDVIAGAKAASDPTWLHMVMEAVVTHGQFETLDARIAELVKKDNIDFLFWELLRNYEEVYAKAGLHWVYVYSVIAISLSPQGLPEADIREAFGIGQAQWSAVRPALMRFCKGNADRICLTKYGWNQTVKNHWSTPLRARVGKMLSDWYLADDLRRARGARTIADIYADIWHLPFDWDGNEKKNLADYDDSIRRFSVSADAVMSLSPQRLNRVTYLYRREGGDMLDLHNTTYGTPVAQLSRHRRIAYYERMALMLSTYGYPADASRCYGNIAMLLREAADPMAPLYQTRQLLEAGRAKDALAILDRSGHLPAKGLFSKLRKEAPLSGKALECRITALVLQNRAYDLAGDYEKLQKSLLPLMDYLDGVDLSDRDEGMRLIRLITDQISSALLTLAQVGSEKMLQEIRSIMKGFSEVLPTFGLTSPIAYNAAMTHALLAFFYNNDPATLRHFAYYALRSAELCFGQGYQYGRAGNLIAVAHYRQTGKYFDWFRSPYVQTRYKPLDYTRAIPSTVDPEVKTSIDIDNKLHARIVDSIQPKQ